MGSVISLSDSLLGQPFVNVLSSWQPLLESKASSEMATYNQAGT